MQCRGLLHNGKGAEGADGGLDGVDGEISNGKGAEGTDDGMDVGDGETCKYKCNLQYTILAERLFLVLN